MVVYRGVLLYGESGVGKSSVVNAGLIPAAIDEGLRADRIRVQPRSGEELVVERIALSEERGTFLPSTFAAEDASSQIVLPVAELRERLAAHAGDKHRPLLIFDQFEELITLFEEAPDANSMGEALACQRRIVDVLVDVLRDETLPVKVLFGFREDYLAKVKNLLRRCPELVDQALRLCPPGTDALPRIIRGPFEDHPDHYEPELSADLATRLSREIESRSATGTISLSEVQIVCLRLWESADPDELLERKHVRGILVDYLEEVLKRFPEELHYPAIALLSQMVTGSGARNVISRDDLVERVRDEEPDITEDRLKDALVALEEKTKLVRREQRHDLDLYEISSEFLVPWIARQRQERVKARDRRRVIARARQERAKLMFAFGVVGTLLFLIGVSFGVLALYLRDQARSREFATRSISQLSVDPTASVRRALDATDSNFFGLAGTPEAEQALRRALAQSRSTVVVGSGPWGRIEAFSSDLERATTIDSVGRPQVLETSTRTVIELPGRASSAQLSSDGRRALLVGADSMARIFDVSSGTLVDVLPGEASSGSFSADGTLVVVAGTDRKVRIFDLAARNVVAVLPGEASSVSLSPDLNLALTVGVDENTRVWEPSTKRIVTVLSGRASSAVFSPDSKRVVTVGVDGKARVWNLSASDVPIAVLTDPAGSISSAGFGSDGQLVTGTLTGSVRAWQLPPTETPVDVLGEHEGSVLRVVFSRDGRLMLTVGIDGRTDIWDLSATEHPIARLTGGPHGRILSAAFTPDATRVVTLAEDGQTRIWTRESGTYVALLAGGLQPLSSAALSLDGKLAFAADSDGEARIWDVSSGENLTVLNRQSSRLVTSAAFSSDGRLLATGDEVGRVRVWKLPDGDTPISELKGDESSIQSAAFSRDGRSLITVGAAGTARIWTIATGESVAVLGSGRPAILSATFSPDSKLVVTAEEDGTARVWERSANQSIALLKGPPYPALSAAFSPRDGRHVITGGGDGRAYMYDCDICGSLGDLRDLAKGFGAD